MKLLFLPLFPLLITIPTDPCQDLSKELKDTIDTSVAEAYRRVASELPCKVRTRGKPRMLRWEIVDRCVNDATNRVDWENLSRQLQNLRAGAPRISDTDFATALEGSLSARAMTYEQLFAVKDAEGLLLPLTNSLLKYLPADSLQNLPVYDRVGTQVGTFLGTYSFERAGGLASANAYRLTLFQYTDRNGNVQSAGEKLLLDSFGVPWKLAKNQRGFRFSSEKLIVPSRRN